MARQGQEKNLFQKFRTPGALLGSAALAAGGYGLLGNHSGNVPPKHPRANTQAVGEVQHNEKALAEKAAAETVVNQAAGKAASKIVAKLATDPATIHYGNNHAFGVFPSDYTNNSEMYVGNWGKQSDRLTLDAIDMPNGPSADSFNQIEINYKLSPTAAKDLSKIEQHRPVSPADIRNLHLGEPGNATLLSISAEAKGQPVQDQVAVASTTEGMMYYPQNADATVLDGPHSPITNPSATASLVEHLEVVEEDLGLNRAA